MSTIEDQESFASLYALASEHIDGVHYAMQEITNEQNITDPERYTVPIMIDQSENERHGYHFRIGFTSLAARLALKKTSVVIPLVISSFEVTPKNRVIAYANSSMRIGGDGLRTANLLIGRSAIDKLWRYIAKAPEDGRAKETLFHASTLIDQAHREAEDQEMIPIL